jgi:hypothetical protein
MDQITEVTRTGYGQRLVGSFLKIPLGLALFAGSFVVLYWNEGRRDLSDMAKTATEISSAVADSSAVNRLVSTSGSLAIDGTVGDGLHLKEGNYVFVDRRVEMFAWIESTSSDTRKELGGSTVTRTTYSYSTGWTSQPRDSARFKEPSGHDNPRLSVEQKLFRVQAAKVGVYGIEPSSVEFPEGRRLDLSADALIPSPDVRVEANYVYRGSGAMPAPHVGDVRISYYVLKPGATVTLFGFLDPSSRILPYRDPKGGSLYRIFDGTRDQSIATLHSEHTRMTWLLRGAGFLMMWFGLSMVMAPISVLLDVIPALGSMAGAITGSGMFFLSVLLTGVTVIASKIAHSPAALVGSIVIAFIVGVTVVGRRRQPVSSPQQQGMRPPQVPPRNVA